MDFQFIWNVFLAMFDALPVTLYMTLISFIASLLLAVFIAVVEYFKVPVLTQIFAVYVSFFRATPLIPQLFLLYFGIPTFVPALRDIPPVTVCIVGLTLNSAAYMKEVVRGAILSVPQGQTEAALAHGLTPNQAMIRIVLPQATRVAVPSLFNNLIDIIKGTSMAFTIGVIEITAVAKLRASVTFNYFESYISLMMIYWLIVFILEQLSKRYERRLSKSYMK